MASAGSHGPETRVHKESSIKDLSLSWATLARIAQKLHRVSKRKDRCEDRAAVRGFRGVTRAPSSFTLWQWLPRAGLAGTLVARRTLDLAAEGVAGPRVPPFIGVLNLTQRPGGAGFGFGLRLGAIALNHKRGFTGALTYAKLS